MVQDLQADAGFGDEWKQEVLPNGLAGRDGGTGEEDYAEAVAVCGDGE